MVSFKKREKDMLDALNNQIDKFKSKNNETFIFVEIGSYLGESLKLLEIGLVMS